MTCAQGGKVVGTDARHSVDKLRQGMTAVDGLQRMIVHRLQAQLDVDIEPTAAFPQFRQRFKIGRMHKDLVASTQKARRLQDLQLQHR